MPVLPVDVDGVTRLMDRRGEFVNDETFLPESNDINNYDRWLFLRDPEDRLCLVDATSGEVALRVDAEDWRMFKAGGAYVLWLQVNGLWGQMAFHGEAAGQWIVEPCAVDVAFWSQNGTLAKLPDGSFVYFDIAGNIVGPGVDFEIDF